MWKPSTWVSLVPTGLGQRKPNHYLDMARVAWANRDQLPFAWRILYAGRLRRLRARHDGPARLDDGRHAPVHGAARAAAAEYGARPRPARARRRDAAPGAARRRSCASSDGCPNRSSAAPASAGFRVIGWDEALDIAAGAPARHRSGSRRVLPDVEGHHERVVLRRAEGRAHLRQRERGQLRAAVPCGLDGGDEGGARARRVHVQLRRLDWRRPRRVLRVEHPQQPAGHDQVSLLRAAARHSDCRGEPAARARPRALLDPVGDRERAVRHQAGRSLVRGSHGRRSRLPRRDAASASRDGRRRSCVPRRAHERVRRRRRRRRSASRGPPSRPRAARRAPTSSASRACSRIGPNTVLVWSMGLTQHVHGVDTIRALINVALARGLAGRPHRGMMPIRGHSGVQGGAEVGCVPAVDDATRARWSALWGVSVPAERGLSADGMLAASAARRHRRLLAGGRQLPRNDRRCAAHPRGAAAPAPSRPPRHRPLVGDAGGPIGHGARAARNDSVRGAWRRPPRPRPNAGSSFHPRSRDGASAARVPEWWAIGRSGRSCRARRGRGAAIRRRGRHQGRDRASGSPLCGHRTPARARRPGAMGRTAPVRARSVRHARRTRARERRAPAGPPPRTAHLFRVDAPRKAVQLHGAACCRSAHRRLPRLHSDQPRRCRADRAPRTARASG